MNSTQVLIGVVGHPSSGKDTVAAHFVAKHGFVHISMGDMIRFYIAEHGMGEATRDLMRIVGTTLREEHGADYFIKLALSNNADVSHLVISGLRTVAEAKAIKGAGGTLVACTAAIENRYAWARERGRIGDNISFETFKQQEDAEASSPNPEAQNVDAVVEMADYVIENTGPLDELERKADELLAKI